MTTDQLFRLLILLSMGANFAISGYFRRKADQQGGQLDQSGNRVLIALRLIALTVLIPLIGFLINTTWMGWARFDAPLWMRWLGFVITMAMIPCIYWLFSTIGNNISPSHTTREDHQLITDGPYRYIRHPLYTFGFMAYIGVALMASMWWVLVGLVIACSAVAWRTPREEANLVVEFGEEYELYMRRTGRYLPRFGR